jgi:hypothetical protein
MGELNANVFLARMLFAIGFTHHEEAQGRAHHELWSTGASTTTAPSTQRTPRRLVHRLRANIPPRRRHIPMLADLRQLDRAAEPRHILILASYLTTLSPAIRRLCDSRHVGLREYTIHPRLHPPQLASVDEKNLASPVAPMCCLIPRQEPETTENPRIQEELRRQ